MVTGSPSNAMAAMGGRLVAGFVLFAVNTYGPQAVSLGCRWPRLRLEQLDMVMSGTGISLAFAIAAIAFVSLLWGPGRLSF